MLSLWCHAALDNNQNKLASSPPAISPFPSPCCACYANLSCPYALCRYFSMLYAHRPKLEINQRPPSCTLCPSACAERRFAENNQSHTETIKRPAASWSTVLYPPARSSAEWAWPVNPSAWPMMAAAGARRRESSGLRATTGMRLTNWSAPRYEAKRAVPQHLAHLFPQKCAQHT